MAEIALYELQHDAQTDGSVSNIKWTAHIQVQYLYCNEIDPIYLKTELKPATECCMC